MKTLQKNNNTDCPLCGSCDNDKVFEDNGYWVLVCHICGLFFIMPYPADIVDVHRHVLAYDNEEIKILDPLRHYEAEVQYYKKWFPLFEEECRFAKRVLDVGCGTGHLLERLGAHKDLHRIGIELNAGRSQMARQKAGCEIYQVPIEKFSSPVKFDVIIMSNTLSHMPSFDGLFNSIALLLNDGGRIILKAGEMSQDIKKMSVFNWGIPDHLHFLGLNTADFICRKYHFAVRKRVRTPYSRDFFSQEAWKMPGRSVFRNIIKQFMIPFLPVLRKCYDVINEEKVYSSFIVLESIKI